MWYNTGGAGRGPARKEAWPLRRSMVKLFALIAACAAVFSLIAFLPPFRRTEVFWISYGFGMFAILFQVYVVFTTMSGKSAKSRFYGFPIARVGVIYAIGQGLLSVAGLALAGVMPVWSALAVDLIALALAVGGCVRAENAREEATRRKAKPGGA